MKIKLRELKRLVGRVLSEGKNHDWLPWDSKFKYEIKVEWPYNIEHNGETFEKQREGRDENLQEIHPTEGIPMFPYYAAYEPVPGDEYGWQRVYLMMDGNIIPGGHENSDGEYGGPEEYRKW